MENNDQLDWFFEQMIAKDKDLSIPPFRSQKPKKINPWIPIGIAASLALICIAVWYEKPIPDPPAEVIIITLHQGENHQQEITIEEKTHLETWESSTSSLLTDY
jgi:hypothetical protein